MITVSNNYQQAINAPRRQIKAKIDVYFDGVNAPPTTFTEQDIQKMTLLEELKAESNTPFGFVSSNELTIDFINVSGDFTPSNPNGKYSQKLLPDILIKPYLGLVLANDSIEWIPLGVFWSKNWNTSSQTITTVNAYDILYNIRQKDMPIIRVQENSNLYDMFQTLFNALGISNYTIDERLKKYKISLGFYEDTVSATLQSMAVAGNCYIKADRYGNIVVNSNFTNKLPVASFTDDVNVIDTQNPQDYMKIYSEVSVNYVMPSIQEETEIARLDNFKIPVGTTTFDNLSFSSPVYKITQVNLLNSKYSSITAVKYGARGIAITVNNTVADEEVTLQVIGYPIQTTALNYAVQDAEAVSKIGVKTFRISNNNFIQTLDTAKEYANSILNFVRNPMPQYIIKTRGDMAIEAGDVITIADSVNKIPETNVVVVRQNMVYDGGLEVDISAQIPVVPYAWVYVSPGLYEYVAEY
ncbi:hypothetical protein THYS13_07320 [Thermoanaerobacter sp. YS13]|uniref:hypothetical protein n=1 Tax=Thermoanaerobacter sp. YS13 TaxID=1511746 RepID=UPI00057432E9|nr:hypothetical protein [Thermoanaerobacter sp. YS13]KHO62669.1 hypothetical protein THYS13_07320 [Thermoanaerobacter sp. YS13]